MTKNMNANATANQAQLDFGKLTQGYFYPDVLTGDVTTLKIPTVNELIFLGKNNILEIRDFFRGEEKKLKKTVARVKHTIEVLPELLSATKSQHCDWCGTNIYPVPTAEELESLSPQALAERSEEALAKMHACRFGREVAAWCKQTPQPCTCQHGCEKRIAAMVEAEITIGEIGASHHVVKKATPGVSWECPHYNECFGTRPFEDRDCVFKHGDQETVEDCVQYLQKVIDDCRARIKWIQKYTSNMTAAKDDKSCIYKPSFSLSVEECLKVAKCGDRIVLLDFMMQIITEGTKVTYGKLLDVIGVRYLLGWNVGNVTYGTLLDKQELNMCTEEGGNITLSGIRCCGSACMPEDDLEYLCEHKDFRQVWAKMKAGLYIVPLESEPSEALKEALKNRFRNKRQKH